MKKARAALFLVKRSVVHLTPTVFLPLYCTLVRPYLEYVIQASSPYSKKDIYHTERFQRLATRMVKGLHHLPYIQRLQRLNLCSLEERGRRADLILAYGISTADMTFRMIYSSLCRLALSFVVIALFIWLVERLLFLCESSSHGTSYHPLSLVRRQWWSSRTD